MFGQMQSGAPMQGGAGKGGIQQPMGGGGKGGMNRGPGGNAQNNPGQTMNPGMGAFANYGKMMQGLGSAPTAATWGSRNPAGVPAWFNSSGLTPMQGAFGNFTPPTPQPHMEPVGGYINGQPAQFHYQAQALNKPAVNNAGLPTGGLLARLYGGG